MSSALTRHRRTLVRIALDAEACRNVVKPFPYRLDREPTIGDLPPLRLFRVAALMAADRFAFAAERNIAALRAASFQDRAPVDVDPAKRPDVTRAIAKGAA